MRRLLGWNRISLWSHQRELSRDNKEMVKVSVGGNRSSSSSDGRIHGKGNYASTDDAARLCNGGSGDCCDYLVYFQMGFHNVLYSSSFHLVTTVGKYPLVWIVAFWRRTGWGPFWLVHTGALMALDIGIWWRLFSQNLGRWCARCNFCSPTWDWYPRTCCQTSQLLCRTSVLTFAWDERL